MAGSGFVVATFNMHAGTDGYGRHFDVVEACREIGADILILQEAFAPRGRPSQAEEVAQALDMTSRELPLARAWRLRSALADAPEEWEPHRPYPRAARALQVGGSSRRVASDPLRYEEGTWGLAMLSREEPLSSEVISLGRLSRDFTSRGALVLSFRSGLTVVGTHMAHSTHGSPLHLRRLRAALPDRDLPAVLGGDMNFWGPPIELLLPGWHRAAKGKTWPAWRPRHQLDHLFVTRSVRSRVGGAVRAGNSDHLPLRAELSF